MRQAGGTGTGNGDGTGAATGERRRRPMRPMRPLAVTGGTLALGCAGLYGAGLLLASDEITAGTKVRGVDIGGMDRDRARQALDRAFGPTAPTAFAIRIGERVERAEPRDLGLSVDSGFDVAVDRVFEQGGKEVKRETFTTRYTPRDTVTCGNR
ncbi:hypothetical protein OHS33_02005 [Streptomyces sp. NBC_00536]|uniref:hypothetical protein n=1 Tax=Streptomyces sp. NBC_00536 TaxID=2975769 RepID=UPI002E7FC50E|nr:hypothetical protein [Streptomyces sp. NBC_00536]WUC77228.1 hypothetical protein OHS33_02005 [Streptomyces sp. NBC_00536]